MIEVTIIETIRAKLAAARAAYPQSRLLISLGNDSCCKLAQELSDAKLVPGMTMLEILVLFDTGITLHGCMCKFSFLLDPDAVVVSPRKMSWLPEPDIDLPEASQ